MCEWSSGGERNVPRGPGRRGAARRRNFQSTLWCWLRDLRGSSVRVLPSQGPSSVPFSASQWLVKSYRQQMQHTFASWVLEAGTGNTDSLDDFCRAQGRQPEGIH